jgi:hypothetical protein
MKRLVKRLRAARKAGRPTPGASGIADSRGPVKRNLRIAKPR